MGTRLLSNPLVGPVFTVQSRVECQRAAASVGEATDDLPHDSGTSFAVGSRNKGAVFY
jgi:hypothetical protein